MSSRSTFLLLASGRRSREGRRTAWEDPACWTGSYGVGRLEHNCTSNLHVVLLYAIIVCTPRGSIRRRFDETRLHWYGVPPRAFSRSFHVLCLVLRGRFSELTSQGSARGGRCGVEGITVLHSGVWAYHPTLRVLDVITHGNFRRSPVTAMVLSNDGKVSKEESALACGPGISLDASVS